MARTKLSDELKAAISGMAPKEKDKLLFRLIAKDDILAAQLRFKLIEAATTAEERREALYTQIENHIYNSARSFYSPGYLLLDIRDISGQINRHVRITKDKYGEIELNFLMLNKTLELLGDQIKRFSEKRSRTFNNYVVKRAIKLLKLLSKMHEDYHLDFFQQMKLLGKHISQQPYMLDTAEEHGLEINWLLEATIPET